MQIGKLYLAAVAVLAALGSADRAQSQAWPERPVSIIVPFAPGGNPDGIARLVAQRLTGAFGRPFIVENRPGGGGAVASEAVAHAQPDGYTLLMASLAQIAILPAMTKAPFDPVKDFAPISVVATNPYFLVVHLGLPVNTLAELVAHIRRQPNKLFYAAPVFGGVSHLAMAYFLKRAGLEMIPAAYEEGGATPLVQLVAGHVPVYFAPLSDVMARATTGLVRVLAVSSAKRVAQFAGVPTFAEQGFPWLTILGWNGLLAPAGTPREIVERIAQEMARAVREPNVTEALARYGGEPLGNTPEEFAAMIAADIAFWGEAVRIAGAGEVTR